MATTDTKLYVALAVLAALGGALYFANKKEIEEEQAYTLHGQTAALPKIDITEDSLKGIDRIVLTKAGEDGGAGSEVELAKKGEDWSVVRPVEAAANQPNVKSLLDNLKTLKVVEAIDSGKTSYDKFKVADGQGLHAVFKKGDAVVLDIRFGESGGRGQMSRLAGKDGVYAVKGYSSYLYDRDVKGWRDTTIFKFEDTAVTEAAIQNEHGTFTFKKDGADWKGKHKPAKGGVEKDIDRFEGTKVGDMLRAYKALNADGFAEKGKTASDLGLDQPSATLVITLNDGAKREIKVGATAEGSSRWAQASGIEEFVSISSWAADWALAEPKKFQKADETADAGADTPPANPHMKMDSEAPKPGAGAKPAASAKPAAPKPAMTAKPATSAAAPKPAASSKPAAPKPATSAP